MSETRHLPATGNTVAPPLIFACVGDKGGTGKTTVATNLAAELQHRYGRVLLVDGEGRDAKAWAERGRDSRHEPSTPTTVDMGADMHRSGQLPAMRMQYAHIVIDTPPGDQTGPTKIRRSALLVADVAIVICRPSQHNLNAIGLTLDLLDEVRETVRPDLKAALVITHAPSTRTRIMERSIIALRGEQDIHVCQNMLTLRNAPIGEAEAAGVGITVYKPKSKAAFEMRALADELLQLATGREGLTNVAA